MATSAVIESQPPTPQAAPAGSSAVTAASAVSPALLAYLADLKRAAVLSAANVGSATARRIAAALEAVDVLGDLSDYQIDASPLDGLANGATSAAFSAPLSGTSSARVVILLGSMQAAAGGTVVLSGAGASYSLALPTTAGPLRIEFADLPAALAAEFTVQNDSGVAFPASSNSIVVLPV